MKCICCQGYLLRHVRHSDIYWYCPNCRQEMPTIGVTGDVLSVASRAGKGLPAGR